MTDVLNEQQVQLCNTAPADYSDLKALFINCSLKKSPEMSHTQGLMDISIEIMRRNEVEVENIRAIDHPIATGVYPDMSEHGWDEDAWPAIFEKVRTVTVPGRRATQPSASGKSGRLAKST